MKKTGFLTAIGCLCCAASLQAAPSAESAMLGAMRASKCPTERFLEHKISYHQQLVPRYIHQIALGDQTSITGNAKGQWEAYGAKHGFAYKLWTKEDLPAISSFMPYKEGLFFKLFLTQKNVAAATEFLRLFLLREYGGIHIDYSYKPPVWKGHQIDLFDMISPTGLTLTMERSNKGSGSQQPVFASGFIASPPEHPIFVFACEHVRENCSHFAQKTKVFEADYVAGRFFLSKIMHGIYNVAPRDYLKDFGVCP